jgi:hypothetical protein
VADAVSTIQRFEPDDLFEIAQFAFGAANLQALTVAANGNSG